MDAVRHGGDLKELQRTLNHSRSLNLLLAAALVLSFTLHFTTLGTERTVLVPPNISKTFWVTSNQASATYLEDMASFIAWLILDVSPATIDWKSDTLLNYVSPDQYGALKIRQAVEAERLRRVNGATYLLPQQLVVNENKQAVVLRGRLRTTINGQETSADQKAYQIGFEYVGGRVQLSKFEEIPYESQAVQQTVVSKTAEAVAAPAGIR